MRFEFQTAQLYLRNFTKHYVAWSTPNDLTYENVHLEITALSQNTDSTTAFGFICAQQTQDWSFYYVAITPAGNDAMIRATTGESDVILTKNSKLN